MQFPPIEIIFNLHPPILEVYAIKLFYSKRLSCFLCHCSHSNLNKALIPVVGNLTKIPTCEKQNRPSENTCQRKQPHAQNNIYVVRQFAYVHGVAGISLLSGKIQQCTRTLSRNPNPNYTLALSHRNNKNRGWLPLFSLFSLMRLLTRLIGITPIHTVALNTI